LINEAGCEDLTLLCAIEKSMEARDVFSVASVLAATVPVYQQINVDIHSIYMVYFNKFIFNLFI
jgi:hypothetical protein